DRAPELLAVERLAPPVTLHDVGQHVLDVLVGRVAPVALQTLPAPADELAFAPDPGVDDPILRVTAERTFHGTPPPARPALAEPLGLELAPRRQLLYLAPPRRPDPRAPQL